ncbi:MAG: flagellar motor switch protein FliM, partial [Rubripirellula sp.]
METVGGAPSDPKAAAGTAQNGPIVGSIPESTNGPNARITAYDFKRPERVGKDQMRAMHSLHEALARNFGA